MDVYGIIGCPIKHSLSPHLQMAAFRHAGLNQSHYISFEVKSKDLKFVTKSIRTLGIKGINVTIPYKEKIVPFLDELSHEAKLIGAVNTIKNVNGKLIGYNTDAMGFKKSLIEAKGPKLRGASIALLGAGGAARAIAAQLALSGAREIMIINRSRDRLNNLLRHIRKHFPKTNVMGYSREDIKLKQALHRCSLLINATSLGLRAKDKLPISLSDLQKNTYIFDIIYKPTQLVKLARKKGFKSSDGMGMLLHQGACAFKIFTGQEPSISVMKRALKTIIKKH